MPRYEAQPAATRKRRNARTGSALPDMAAGRGGFSGGAVTTRLVAVAAATLAAWTLLAPQARAQTGAQTGACGPTRTVVVGDTLTNIAARCGVTPQALREANPLITDPDVVPLGATLTIPGGVADVEPGRSGLEEPPPAGRGLAPVSVVPVGGPLSSRVRIFARNLPPGASALIGGGPRPDAPLLFARAQVDAIGILSVELDLPSWALGAEPAHIVVEAPIGGPWLRAAPYQLAPAR